MPKRKFKINRYGEIWEENHQGESGDKEGKEVYHNRPNWIEGIGVYIGFFIYLAILGLTLALHFSS